MLGTEIASQLAFAMTWNFASFPGFILCGEPEHPKYFSRRGMDCNNLGIYLN